MPFFPPPVVDERDALATFLAHQQDALRAVAHGLSDEQAHRAPSASAICVAWLLRHLTVVQLNWLDGARAAPEALTDEQNAVIMARGHDLDGSETLTALLEDFDAAGAAVLTAVADLDPATPMPVPDAPWFPKDVPHWSVRWAWHHLVAELARHAGHGDVVRESVDGATAWELVAAREEMDAPVLGFLQPWTPSDPPFARGVSTVVLAADDVEAAAAWYTAVLGHEPSYRTPAYVEFRLGPHADELGLLDRRYAGEGWGAVSSGTPGGAVAHLSVDDADAALASLLDRGAHPHQPARDLGEAGSGYRGGSVVDPFGNVLGVITRAG